MTIRKAKEKDAAKILLLLSQVLEIHAALRPDVFAPGTTKYTAGDLTRLFADPLTPVFVAVDEDERVLGYVFCRLRETRGDRHVKGGKTWFIDDLCVDEPCRGRRVGEALFRFAVQQARSAGCRDITLNVWAGNDAALRFYEKMGMRPRQTQMEYVL